MPPAKKKAAARGRPCLWNDYKRQSIHEATLRLLGAAGLEGWTMEAVAREVGIAKGTLYLHFADKQALLDDVLQSAFDPLIAQLDQALAGPGAPAQRLREFSRRYFTFFDAHARIFRVLLYERQVTQSKWQRFETPRYQRLVGRLATVITAGIKARQFRSGDARRLAVLFLEMNFALCGLRLADPVTAPPETDARTVSDLFLAGLGRKPLPAARKRSSR
jgi:AcrR family transcriptional regulator